MKPAPLAYHRPHRLEDALQLLADGGFEARIIAGGQSLMPMLNLRLVAADDLIDIRGIEALREVADEPGQVRLGACVTHADIQYGRVMDGTNGLLPYVAARIAYQAVRNRGTIGGSLSLADPSADWTTTLACLGAEIEWQGASGAGSCPADEFVTAAYTTRLDVSDILTGIRIPRLDPDARWGTYKLCRKTGEFAHAMAIVLRRSAGARAFLGATNGSPVFLPETARLLDGFRNWDAGHASAIGEAFDGDVAASGREFEEAHLWQSRTCVIRAAMMSFGETPPTIGRF